ncbi:hypothetical protein J2X46_002725 [Nocardioides sp. BE266]|nr:hypothetical protein [Nocardioides sp. BE266]
MTAPIDWSSPLWGKPGHNVHEAAWAADRKHADETDEEFS